MPEDNETYYQEIRKLANDNVVRSSASLDYIIFAVTTGALVLASGVAEKFSNPILPLAVVLAISIVSLLAALLIHSISYLQSIKYNRTVVTKLDSWHDKDYEGSFRLPENKVSENGRNLLDNWAFGLMWAGMLFLAIFIVFNIIKLNDYGKEESPNWRQFHQVGRQHFEESKGNENWFQRGTGRHY